MLNAYTYILVGFLLLHFSHGDVVSFIYTSWKVWGPTPALIPLQIKMLTDRKRELEHRLSAMMEENDLLQGTVEELQDRVLILERQSHDKDLQVRRQQWEREEGRRWEMARGCGLG